MAELVVEVAYARPDTQFLAAVELPAGACVRDAIARSGVLEAFAELELESLDVGIFSQRCSLQQSLEPGDRVEIYRPLVIDPKEARRQRAKKGAS